MTDPYLLLWLEAPLQSWGHDSKFGRRDSLDFPTKSGVFGLLCCALGAEGKQTERLARWADCDMQVQAYVLKDKRGQPLPRQPLLRDFHMVGSGYNDQDPWQNLLVPKTSDGKKAVGGGTKMTYRYYLQDMAFAVVLQGSKDELAMLEAALHSPAWDLYLGRKNCVPTEFIAQGIYEHEELAFNHAGHMAEAKNRCPVFSVLQGEHHGEVLTLNDVPVQFGDHKLYRDRRVTVMPVA
ncbi:type I-E CRISPR-associated protein Cas5/CasD [Bowmanella denitrificans]|uniref:Type I-E CRISPR-associated protein Cas5/CasD n=1 Tax=Bowmanella denitrificans TaxID=366582 RepID=A0ABP3HGA5_9ALTE